MEVTHVEDLLQDLFGVTNDSFEPYESVRTVKCASFFKRSTKPAVSDSENAHASKKSKTKALEDRRIAGESETSSASILDPPLTCA